MNNIKRIHMTKLDIIEDVLRYTAVIGEIAADFGKDSAQIPTVNSSSCVGSPSTNIPEISRLLVVRELTKSFT